MSSSTRALLVRALELLQRDAPQCLAGVADALGPVAVAVAVDGERIRVTAVAGRVVVATLRRGRRGARDGERLVDVVTCGEAVLALIDGADALLPAILANRVRVRTRPAHAHRLFTVVSRFVDGCARSAGGPALLAEYRDHVAAARGRT